MAKLSISILGTPKKYFCVNILLNMTVFCASFGNIIMLFAIVINICNAIHVYALIYEKPISGNTEALLPLSLTLTLPLEDIRKKIIRKGNIPKL